MLGIIPSWQFNPDPRTNPALTPYVQYPAGMTQVTVQPVGPYYSGGAMAGLSADMAMQANATFESFWWRHRRALVAGGLLAVAAAAVTAIVSVVR